jgi:hypothetical protein
MENQQNVYKPLRATLVMQPNKRIVIENEKSPFENTKGPAKILFSTIKVANGVAYRFLVIEFGNGTRKLFIERQSTDRLPRAIVKSPPAPLTHFVKELKRTYGIE